MSWEKDLSKELTEDSRPWETKFVMHVVEASEKTEQVKLTEADRAQIRKEYVRGSRTHGQPALARKYKVTQPAINYILQGGGGRRVTRTLEEKLCDGVDRRGPDDCWPWTKSTNDSGYGQIETCSPRRSFKAHRVAYERANGPIPEGQCVLHECDNPSCCNPAHLFLGTQIENIQDMKNKGRQSRGEGRPLAKLTEEQVAEIRREYIKGSRTHGGSALGRKHGVHKVTIHHIVNGNSWK